MSGSVRLAVVGAGWWSANHHLPSLTAHPHADVIAVCDPVEARAKGLGEHARARHFATLDAAVTALELDAAVISTPHATHHAIARTAIDAGMHVFVEKPLALTAADAFDLVTRAEDADVHLSVGYTHHFEDGARFVRHAVRTEIGELLQVTMEFSSRAGELFAAAHRNEAADDPFIRHPEGYSAANGGGQAHTQLTHALGMLCWTTDEQIDRIAAFTRSRSLEVDVDDAAAFRLRNGATGVIVGTGDTAPHLPVRQHIRYTGTAGVVEQDLHRARVILHRDDGSLVVREPGQHQPAYRAGEPVRAFVNLIRDEGPNHSPGRPAACAVAATEALLRSAATGQVVRPPVLPA
ncbi:Gfo/Idh/MocA family protein [Streptomyces aculeolatus]